MATEKEKVKKRVGSSSTPKAKANRSTPGFGGGPILGQSGPSPFTNPTPAPAGLGGMPQSWKDLIPPPPKGSTGFTMPGLGGGPGINPPPPTLGPTPYGPQQTTALVPQQRGLATTAGTHLDIPRTIGAPKPSVWGRMASLGGKAMGVAGKLGGAGMAKQAYDIVNPGGKDFYNPAEVGGMVYDKVASALGGIFGRGNSGGNNGVQNAYSNGGVPDLPPLDGEDSLPFMDQQKILPAAPKSVTSTVKKPSLRMAPKAKPISPMAAFARQDMKIDPDKLGTLSPINNGQEREDISSTTLPDNVDMGAKNPNTAFQNDSMYPDTQQSSRKSAMDRYSELINNIPDRGNYINPGIGRKIIAALAGASEGYRGGAGAGFEASQGIINRPFEDARNEHSRQIDELEPLAKLESQQEINQARITEQARKTDLINRTKTAEVEVRRLAAEGKISNDQDRNEINMFLAEIKQDVANNQHELAEAKLEQLKTYQTGMLGIGQQRANAASTSAQASMIGANASAMNAQTNAAKPNAATKPMSVTQQYQVRDKARMEIISQMILEGSLPAEGTMGALQSDPNVKSEFQRRYNDALKAAGIGGQ